MSYRTQQGHLCKALATEDARHRDAYDRRRVDAAMAEYRRTKQIPELPARLLEQFTSRLFCVR